MTDLVTIDVAGVEEWREYDFNDRNEPYIIEKPTKVQFRHGGSTHRVTDSEGVVHCVPAPGHNGCVLRWKGAVIA